VSAKHDWIILTEFDSGKPILVSVANILCVEPSDYPEKNAEKRAHSLALNDGKLPIYIRESAMDVANKLAMVGAICI